MDLNEQFSLYWEMTILDDCSDEIKYSLYKPQGDIKAYNSILMITVHDKEADKLATVCFQDAEAVEALATHLKFCAGHLRELSRDNIEESTNADGRVS